MTGLLLNLMPGSSLLSHGETPHYHRRYGVSLLIKQNLPGGLSAVVPPDPIPNSEVKRRSADGSVGPPRYGRQANSVLSDRFCVLI